jgi:hypothetical protein
MASTRALLSALYGDLPKLRKFTVGFDLLAELQCDPTSAQAEAAVLGAATHPCTFTGSAQKGP